MPDRMRRVQILLPEEEHERLQELARERRRSVAGLVREAVEGRQYRLIERLADEICGRLWGAYALAEAAVTVRKPAPPVGLPIGAAAAEVVRRA